MLVSAAAARGAAVDRHELAEDVAAGRSTSARRLAAVLQVLRHQADRREREDLASRRRSRSSRRSTADAPIRQCCADPHVRADRSRTARRSCPRRSRRVGCTMARRIDVGAVGLERRAAGRPRPRPGRRRSATPCACASGGALGAERHLEAQPIAGHDLPAELRVVDAAQVDARVRRGAPRARAAARPPPAPAPRSSARRASAARPGKWPWKNSSLTVTFLTATSRAPGSCCDDRVHAGRTGSGSGRRSRSMGMLMATVRHPARSAGWSRPRASQAPVANAPGTAARRRRRTRHEKRCRARRLRQGPATAASASGGVAGRRLARAGWAAPRAPSRRGRGAAPRARRRVEPLDDVGGEVEAGSAQTMPASAWLNRM